ncbi:MAG: F0F1 ATP synthase subunit B [Lewinellaceae bacterium]|nr:hypothetical protein [Phaeodactylibacter sp.]MCB9042003.1 F0F1 ATP synthase subunit B [Lewinellaceae bacterium]
MLIDWFTVIAQLLNFLILVWLLRRFLYQPVLKAMAEREKRVTARLRDAETREAEAEKEQGRFQQMNTEMEQQREGLLQKAKAEAEAERQRLLEEAREGHRRLRARLQETLNTERANLSQGIIRRMQEEIFEIARKVLADLADASLETQMAAVFIRRLEELNEEERKQLSAALQASNHTVAVHSTFHLSPEQQKAIQSAVKKILPSDGQVRFEATSAQALNGQAEGIELTAEGYKISWSVTDYLGSLEKRIATILEEELEPEPEPKTDEHAA